MNSTLSTQPQLTADYQCFSHAKRNKIANRYSKDVTNLYLDLRAAPPRDREPRLAALGRVIPLLVCGEQSAISVFGASAQEKVVKNEHMLRREFMRIEAEEMGHELLWQSLAASLPIPEDATRLKRQAALFFAKLGRANSIGEHFAQVSQLDSAVGAMMWCLERSEVAKDQRIHGIANLIKKEEARHVAVSRRFALGLGVPRDHFQALGAKIRQELISLLLPVADSIEALGIDATVMFRRIGRSGGVS